MHYDWVEEKLQFPLYGEDFSPIRVELFPIPLHASRQEPVRAGQESPDLPLLALVSNIYAVMRSNTASASASVGGSNTLLAAKSAAKG